MAISTLNLGGMNTSQWGARHSPTRSSEVQPADNETRLKLNGWKTNGHGWRMSASKPWISLDNAIYVQDLLDECPGICL